MSGHTTGGAGGRAWITGSDGSSTIAADPVSLWFSPSLQPIRDLSPPAERVGSGDFSQRLPVVQDDDLGSLAAVQPHAGQSG